MDRAPRNWTRGDLLVVGGAGVTIVAAFLNWYDGYGSAFATGLRPVATFAAVCAVLVVGRRLLETYTEVTLPDRLGRFTWFQIDVFLAGYAAITGVSFLVMDAQGASRGIGLYLDAPATIALVAGVLVEHRERRSAVTPG